MLQRRRFSCLSSEIDEPLNADMYIHGSLPLLVILTFYIGYIFLTGGLKAVIYTDTLQTVIMVAGAIVLMILSKLSDIYAFTVSKKTQIYLYSPLYSNR